MRDPCGNDGVSTLLFRSCLVGARLGSAPSLLSRHRTSPFLLSRLAGVMFVARPLPAVHLRNPPQFLPLLLAPVRLSFLPVFQHFLHLLFHSFCGPRHVPRDSRRFPPLYLLSRCPWIITPRCVRLPTVRALVWLVTPLSPDALSLSLLRAPRICTLLFLELVVRCSPCLCHCLLSLQSHAVLRGRIRCCIAQRVSSLLLVAFAPLDWEGHLHSSSPVYLLLFSTTNRLHYLSTTLPAPPYTSLSSRAHVISALSCNDTHPDMVLLSALPHLCFVLACFLALFFSRNLSWCAHFTRQLMHSWGGVCPPPLFRFCSCIARHDLPAVLAF